MENQPISDDDLQGQMAAVRWALARDVLGVREDVQTLADWRYHFRRHPALCCAGAAALGYLLVPRPRREQVVVSHQWQAPAAIPLGRPAHGFSLKSAALAALGMAASAATRQALTFAQQQGRDYVARKMAERQAGAANGPRQAAPFSPE